MNPIILRDGENYKCDDYSSILSSYYRLTDILKTYIKDDKCYFKFSYVGLLVIEKQLYCVVPKNYPVDKKDSFSDAALLVSVLLKYSTEPFFYEDSSIVGDTGISNKLFLQIELLRNYIEYGLIDRHKHEESNTSGRVQWQKTLIKKQPISNHNGPIYVEAIYLREHKDHMNLVSKIHSAVIYECSIYWGWFLGVDVGLNEQELPCTIEEALQILERELSSTYISWEIHTIKNLIVLLNNCGGREKVNNIDFYGVKGFHYIWESVCREICNDEYHRFKRFMPQPKWDSEFMNAEISQRPDIFMVKGQDIFIVDAKYYTFQNAAPGWPDIVKQYFYRLSLLEVIHNLPKSFTNVYNVFLFPDIANDVKYIGKVSVPNSKFGEIKAYSINTKKSLEFYIYKDKKYSDQIIKFISNVDEEK